MQQNVGLTKKSRATRSTRQRRQAYDARYARREREGKGGAGERAQGKAGKEAARVETTQKKIVRKFRQRNAKPDPGTTAAARVSEGLLGLVAGKR